jgi:hypothetical protein
MKFLGFLMLFAGWLLVVAALAILPPAALRSIFILAGVGVEIIGLALAVRSHPILRGEEE